MWQEAQATFLKGEMFKSKFINLPSISTESYPLNCNVGGLPARVGGGRAADSPSASLKMELISRRTLAISEFKSAGRMPGGYGLYGGAEFAAAGDAAWGIL